MGRISITLDDSIIEEIDRRRGDDASRSTYAAGIIMQQLRSTHAADPDHDAAHTQQIRIEYQEEKIRDLLEERNYYRGEIARLQQTNNFLTGRLLPPPRPGILSRIKASLTGGGE
ncbi:MAG: hypothetical protein D5R99_01575 [Methanocalculus sp. MSAO_Arc1]|uniref:hypothetical protein n=1 Tax=Methanocalculus sp. MSAO_Arc1 TaxID=2293854 RepID=UPI000FF24B96|nr:hypothetical protein [Methanocalculus sp. MSAO_Arc1]RQD81608.1 MAG: hypothetical protein D5R99_01575 [Methanocalculus sp. MSAO_Arc1]